MKTVVATIDYYRFYFRVYVQYISGFECVHKVVLYTVNMFTVNMFTVTVNMFSDCKHVYSVCENSCCNY